METANAMPQKQTLRNGKSQDWIEHPSFGLGQASESREGKLDIDFLNHGRRTLLKSTELKSTASPNPDFKFPRAQRVFPNLAPSSHPSPRPSTIVPQLSNEGGSMSNLSSALQQLRQEQKQAQQQVEKLQSAISVIQGLLGRHGSGTSAKGAGPGRILSAAA